MATVADVLLQCEECKAHFENFEVFNDHPCCKTVEDTHDATEGPISELIPKKYHTFVSKSVLKSYVCDNEREANTFRRRADPADIPIIVYNRKNPIYKEVQANLNEKGKAAVNEIRPWLINLMVDWANFDDIICHFPDKEHAHGADSACASHQDEDADAVTVATASDNESQSAAFSTSSRQTWSKEAVLKLIELHTGNENMFIKPGIKKKSIWESIATKISELDQSFSVSGVQCEQKWKNLTKKYRDVVDHNNRSGNDVKECPFYKELNDCYGYRPNVKPEILKGSMPGCSSKSIDQNNNDECSDDTSTESSPVQSKSLTNEQNTQVATEPKKRKKYGGSEEKVLTFLQDMQKEMKDSQKAILNHLKQQHEEKMKNEDAKLALMAKLVDKVTAHN